VKILITGTGLFSDNYGGGQIYIRNLVFELILRNHDVTYVSLISGNTGVSEPLWIDHDKFRECRLKLPRSLRMSNPLSGISYDHDLAIAFIRDIKPDVIHAHGEKQMFCVAAHNLGIPCVVTAHHGGIVCPAGALLNSHDEICRIPAGQNTCLPCCVRSIPGGKLWLTLLRLIPFDVQLCLGEWLHSRRFMYFVTPLGTLALSIRHKLAATEILGSYASRLIAPSHAVGDALVRNGIPECKIAIIPHGIPLPRKQPLRPDLGKGPVRFLYVGRISYVKGVHVMLEAFSGLAPETYELHIVGGAGNKVERRYLEGLQRRYTSLNAVWHGARSHEAIPHHIAACDVMVHPAIFLEVFGLTIAEALAVGRPVIATRCGGAEEQIHDGKNGLLVPPNDVVALRQAVQSVIDAPEILIAMARQCGDVVSIERNVQVLEQLYSDLL
jgi:glycosyltransferase involved in cell wall biosynthesis